MKQVILASGSPRRRELLTALGVPFKTLTPNIDETVRAGAEVTQVVEELARAKAAAAAVHLPSEVIIAADTLVNLDGVPLGKPASPDEARGMLRRLRSREHEVATGVCVRFGHRTLSRVISTKVKMRDYSDAAIERSIRRGTPFDKAGAYAIQDDHFRPVESIDGCYCNVMGLSLWTAMQLLADLGARVPMLRPDATRPICAVCPEQPSGTESRPLHIPANALVVLCGASGSGKSTFARAHFLPTQVVSSDQLRAMVSDDEADQSASGPAFVLLRMIARYRLERGRLTVVDTTALHAGERRALLQLARAQGAPAVAVVFSAPLAACLTRNGARARRVQPDVVIHQHELLQSALLSIGEEGFDAVYVLGAGSAARIELEPPRLRPPQSPTEPAHDPM